MNPTFIASPPAIVYRLKRIESGASSRYEPRMRTFCIYHDDCLDGAAAAAVVRHRFPGAKLLPAVHGKPPPEGLEGGRVVVVDFSFSAENTEILKRRAREFLWFDHHKTALPVLEQTGVGIIDLKESGATLTWKQLFPAKPLPKVLAYVRDKDLWLWRLPRSRDLVAALVEMEGILEPGHRVWTKLLKGLKADEWKTLIAMGAQSRRLLQERIEKAVSRGFEVRIDGTRALAVNWSDDASDVGEYIYKKLGYEVALIFSYSRDEWKISLRSAKVDVSKIAVRQGGGGHKGAAGFRSKDIAWLFEKRVP